MGIPAALDGKLRVPLIGAPMFKEIRREFDGTLILSGCLSNGADIVYSSLFSGIHGNYLKGGVDEILPAAELVVRIEKEYDAARALFGTG